MRWSSQGLWALPANPTRGGLGPPLPGKPPAHLPFPGPRAAPHPRALQALWDSVAAPEAWGSCLHFPRSTFCHQRFNQCPPEISGRPPHVAGCARRLPPRTCPATHSTGVSARSASPHCWAETLTHGRTLLREGARAVSGRSGHGGWAAGLPRGQTGQGWPGKGR